ncbi:MAG: ABC-2 transporter permease [Syntrophomonadaceae bacterium]|nr:ABC-2 transporter permease [Syntrophomonadaceae bacterium]
MKGLLLKDFYLIESVLWINLAIFTVVGIALAFFTSTWVLTVLATIMLGTVSVSTINMDKTSGWRKFSGVIPVAKKLVMDSKYALYLLLSGAGCLFGMLLGVVTSLLKNQLEYDTMLIFIGISIAIALISGSITIPCNFLFSEEKSIISVVISYPLAAAIFAGTLFLFENQQAACGAAALLGIMVFIISWRITRRLIAAKDIA